MMADQNANFQVLKDKIKSRDADLQRAGEIGKQLLAERQKLQDQVNVLKQEKHSLRRNLESKCALVESLTAEIELQRSSYDELALSSDALKKENSNLKEKLREEEAKNEDFKHSMDELLQKDTAYNKEIQLLEKELEKQKQMLHVSLNETNTEEFNSLINELQKCNDEKNEMLAQLTNLQSNLEDKKSEEVKLLNLLEQLQLEITDKDERLRSYTVIVQKSKEDIGELMGEIEMLKFQQTDVNQRGNSIFSEVEDHRKLVETKYAELKDKCEDLKQQNDIYLKEISKAKNQLAIALSMFSQRVETQYVDELQSSLSNAKKEIVYLTKRLGEYVNSERDTMDTNVSNNPLTSGNMEYNYLRTLYSKSQKMVEKLEKDLQHQRLLKIAEDEKLQSSQKKLYLTEQALCAHKAEILKLKLKIEDMDKGKPQEIIRPNVEVIPAFGQNLTFFKDKLKVNKTLATCSENKENTLDEQAKFENTNYVPSENATNKQSVQSVRKHFKTNAVQSIDMSPKNQNCAQQ